MFSTDDILCPQCRGIEDWYYVEVVFYPDVKELKGTSICTSQPLNALTGFAGHTLICRGGKTEVQPVGF